MMTMLPPAVGLAHARAAIRRPGLAGLALLGLLAGCDDDPLRPDAPEAGAPSFHASASGVLARAQLYVDPYSRARHQVEEWQSSRPLDAAQIEKIAAQPVVPWFGGWTTSIRDAVGRFTTTATDRGALPVFVVSNLPQMDCGALAPTAAEAYRSWIGGVAEGIGGRAAAVILEPNSLAALDCLSETDREARHELLRFAVATLRSSGPVAVYLDAGNAWWHPAEEIAARLRRAGVEAADGFALNVGSTIDTETSLSYGTRVSALTGDARFVLDTGRNGLGPAPDGAWCNPAGRALGPAPTTAPGHPLVDAFLWIKYPGESDGQCNGGPPAGAWWPEYALGLAQGSLLPAGGSFFSGAYLGDAVSTPERIEGAIRDFASLAGKRPALVKTFYTMDCDFSSTGWCGRILHTVAGSGATNYVALDLKWPGSPSGGVLAAVAAGQADATLTRIARQMASLRATVLLEPAWEMNGDWNYTWQGVANGGDASAPQRYVAAWRRMVEIFRREGAGNVRWVFNPNTGNPLTHQATGASHWNWYANYYPGDAYVDYVGAHGFNGSTVWGGGYQDFYTMFQSPSADHMLTDLARRFPSKPIIVGEFASDEAPGRDKGEWIADAYRRLRAHPNVVGAVWFNMDKEADWRIDSSASALSAFRAAMRDPRVVTAYGDGMIASGTRLASW